MSIKITSFIINSTINCRLENFKQITIATSKANQYDWTCAYLLCNLLHLQQVRNI